MSEVYKEIAFKELELSDSKWIRELLSYADLNSEDYNFTYQFLWRKTFKTAVARYGDWLLVRFNFNGSHSYLFPAGRGESSELKALIESLIAGAAADGGGELAFYGVLEHQLKWLEERFAGRFTAEPFRMGWDYLYSAESLLTLKGKKYQSKRNFANGFRKSNIWAFEPITKENIAECYAMNDEWCRRNGCGKEFWKENEFCAVREALANYFELGLQGGLLRVFEQGGTEAEAGVEATQRGRVVAFTIGELTNSDTLLVHIEKAFTDIRGAYQTISQEFLSYMNKLLLAAALNNDTLRDNQDVSSVTDANDGADGANEAEALSFRYVNREDDSGDENLRKAKMEYHPLRLIEKSIVTFQLK